MHYRWKEVVQDMKEELLKTEQVLSLWQKYVQVSDHCSLRLQHLQQQWEALSSCLPSPQQDVQAVLSSVEVSSGSEHEQDVLYAFH